MSLRTAGMLRVNRLYHYQPFHAVRLSKMLSDNAIYCSNPKDFNDPWDCRPWFNYDALSDPAVYERHIQWYITVTRKHCPGLSDNEILRRAQFFRSNPTAFRNRIAESSSAIEAAIYERFRVYCLTTRPDSELMWAHYSQKHQGLCLEFAVDNPVFSGALKVEYFTHYPIFDVTSSSDDQNLLPLLSKSAAWSYEEEYRLIAQEQGAATPHQTLVTRANLLDVPIGMLTAIILGCMAPSSVRQEICEIIAKSGASVALKTAVRAPNRFELRIV